MTCFHIFRKQNLPCGGTGACPPDHPGSLAVKATFRKPRQSLVCANLAANLPLERFALENLPARPGVLACRFHAAAVALRRK